MQYNMEAFSSGEFPQTMEGILKAVDIKSA